MVTKVLMIGTPTCYKCKLVKPEIIKVCESRGINFEYHDLQNLPTEVRNVIILHRISQAPVVILYKDADIHSIFYGNDILDSILNLFQ